MKLHGRDPEGVVDLCPYGHVVWLCCENGVGRALEAGPEICAKIVNGTNEIRVTCEEVGHKEAEEDSADPGTDEAFDCLLGGKFNELCTAEGDAADIGEYVVGDDEGGGQEEPYHAFKYVVHDEVGLYNDQVEGHVGPGELGKLEAVVTFLEGADKENES